MEENKKDRMIVTGLEGWFRFFFRKNYPDAGEYNNEELDEVGEGFNNYLHNKLREEQLDNILPKSIHQIVMNMNHPFKTNGFEPALVLHFGYFVEEEKNKILETATKEELENYEEFQKELDNRKNNKNEDEN